MGKETFQERLAKIEKWIQEYLTQKKIVDVSVNNMDEYLDLSHDRLSKMNPDQLGEIAFMLAKHAFFVQKLYNEENSKYKWVASHLRQYIVPKFVNYNCNYKSYDEKEALVVNDDDYAKKVGQFRNMILCRLTSLDDLAMRIQFMAQTLLQLQQSKRQYTR